MIKRTNITKLVTTEARISKINRFPINPDKLKHIFRKAEGHIPDTPANRNLIQSVADDAANFLGTDKFGNTWSAKTLDNGTQAWVQTRNSVIQNAGVNKTPRTFNPETGLSSPTKP